MLCELQSQPHSLQQEDAPEQLHPLPPFDVIFEADLPFVVPTHRCGSEWGPAAEREGHVSTHCRVYNNELYDDDVDTPARSTDSYPQNDPDACQRQPQHRTYHFHCQPAGRPAGDRTAPASWIAGPAEPALVATRALGARHHQAPAPPTAPALMRSATLSLPGDPRPLSPFTSLRNHRSPAAAPHAATAAAAVTPPTPSASRVPTAGGRAARSPLRQPLSGPRAQLRTAHSAPGTSSGGPVRDANSAGHTLGGPLGPAAGNGAPGGASPRRSSVSNSYSAGSRRRVNLLELLKNDQRSGDAAGGTGGTPAQGPAAAHTHLDAHGTKAAGQGQASRVSAAAAARTPSPDLRVRGRGRHSVSDTDGASTAASSRSDAVGVPTAARGTPRGPSPQEVRTPALAEGATAAVSPLRQRRPPGGLGCDAGAALGPMSGRDTLDATLDTIPEEQASEATLGSPSPSPRKRVTPGSLLQASAAPCGPPFSPWILQQQQQPEVAGADPVRLGATASAPLPGADPGPYEPGPDGLVRQLLALVQTQAVEIQELKRSVAAAASTAAALPAPAASAAPAVAPSACGPLPRRDVLLDQPSPLSRAVSRTDCLPNAERGTNFAPMTPGRPLGQPPCDTACGPQHRPQPGAAIPAADAALPLPLLRPHYIPVSPPLQPARSGGGASDASSSIRHDSDASSLRHESGSQSSDSRLQLPDWSVRSCWAWGSSGDEGSSVSVVSSGSDGEASAVGSARGAEAAAAAASARTPTAAAVGGGVLSTDESSSHQVAELREQVCRLAHVVMAMQLTQEHMCEGLLALRAREGAGPAAAAAGGADCAPAKNEAAAAIRPGQQTHGGTHTSPPLPGTQTRAELPDRQPPGAAAAAAVEAIGVVTPEGPPTAGNEELCRALLAEQQELRRAAALDAAEAAAWRQRQDAEMAAMQQRLNELAGSSAGALAGAAAPTAVGATDPRVDEQLPPPQAQLQQPQSGQQYQQQQQRESPDVLLWLEALSREFSGLQQEMAAQRQELAAAHEDLRRQQAGSRDVADHLARGLEQMAECLVLLAAQPLQQPAGCVPAGPEPPAQDAASASDGALATGSTDPGSAGCSTASGSTTSDRVSTEPWPPAHGTLPAPSSPPSPSLSLDSTASESSSSSASFAACSSWSCDRVTAAMPSGANPAGPGAAGTVTGASAAAAPGAGAAVAAELRRQARGLQGALRQLRALMAAQVVVEAAGTAGACTAASRKSRRGSQLVVPRGAGAGAGAGLAAGCGRPVCAGGWPGETAAPCPLAWKPAGQGPAAGTEAPPQKQQQPLQEEPQRSVQEQQVWQRLQALFEGYEELRSGEAVMAQTQEALVDLVTDLRHDLDLLRRRAARRRTRLASHTHTHGSGCRSGPHDWSSATTSTTSGRTTPSSTRTSTRSSRNASVGGGSEVNGRGSGALGGSGSYSASPGSRSDDSCGQEDNPHETGAAVGVDCPSSEATARAWVAARGGGSGGSGLGPHSEGGAPTVPRALAEASEVADIAHDVCSAVRHGRSGGHKTGRRSGRDSGGRGPRRWRQLEEEQDTKTEEGGQEAGKEEGEEAAPALGPLAQPGCSDNRRHLRVRRGARSSVGSGGGGEQVAQMMSAIQHVSAMLSSSLAQALSRIAAQGDDIAQLKRSLLLVGPQQ